MDQQSTYVFILCVLLFFIACLGIIGIHVVSYYFIQDAEIQPEGFLNGLTTNNSTKEDKVSQLPTYILLGDSIFKNNAYVAYNESIEHLLTLKNNNTYCYAVDHSKIVDVYFQINQISIDMDSINTYVFLSVGGNNLLSHYIENKTDMVNFTVLKYIIKNYEVIVKTIRDRLPNSNIVLVDLYYPNSPEYNNYRTIIRLWNEHLYDFSNNPQNNIHSILKISSHLTQPDDFSFGFEPSPNGGRKIANLILQKYTCYSCV